MTKNLAKFDLKSSFLSCEKDTDTILRKLFIESRPYSDMLKRLLVISTKDCLDNETSELYKKKIQEASVKKLIDDGKDAYDEFKNINMEIDKLREEKSEINKRINILHNKLIV